MQRQVEEVWNESTEQRAFNPRALAGMTVFTLIAMAALFVVPLYQGNGLSFVAAFALLCAIEGGAALGVIFFLNRLYTERTYD
jgi:hypothetical protein